MRFSYDESRDKRLGDRTTLYVTDNLQGKSWSLWNTDRESRDSLNFVKTLIQENGDPELIAEACDNARDFRRREAQSIAEMLHTETVAGTLIPAEFLGMIGEGVRAKGITRFFERLAKNPLLTARSDLFRWILANPSIQITNDGLIVGYRGLKVDMYSVREGYGQIQRPGAEELDIVINGSLDNSIGNVVSMPRELVDHDPNHSCSFGLHVGTWDYASSWGDRDTTIAILLDPADVIVVPNSDANKMRVCRFLSYVRVDGMISAENIQDQEVR